MVSTSTRPRRSGSKPVAAVLCPIILMSLFVAGMLALIGCEPAKPGATPTKAVAPEQPPAQPDKLAETLARFNRGAACLEQYQYGEAAKAFGQVLEAVPAWTAARFNLGLALLNMQEERGALEHLAQAREAFERILAAEPANLHARFCLGLLEQHLGDNDKALACFESVWKADQEDPYAAYKHAEALLSLGRNDEGQAMLEKVVALDPGFISGVYRLAQQYQRTRQQAKALPLFKRFKDLNDAELTGGAYLVQKQYGMAGKYYTALGADSMPVKRPEPPARRFVFSPDVKKLPVRTQAWRAGGVAAGMPGIAVGDVDRDGDLDLCVTGAGEKAATLVMRNDGTGGFTPGPEIAADGVSPCFGDVDNDGDLDLWLGCAAADRLFENDGTGEFKESAPALPRPAGPATTVAARLFDADSDGDLDLLSLRLAEGSIPAAGAARGAPSSLYQNNRDGTYEDAASRLSPDLAGQAIGAFVYDDFDDDRDVDCIVFLPGAPNGGARIWVNDRCWQYRSLDLAISDFSSAGVTSATLGDPDKDGDRDLLVFTGDKVAMFVNRGHLRFELKQEFAARSGPLGGTGGQFADMDNDGDLDIVIPDARRRDGSRGPALLANEWPRDSFADATQSDPGNLLGALRFEGAASGVAADFNGDGRSDLLFAPAGDESILVENATAGGHWLAIDLAGTRTEDKKTRSNNSGIGARVEIKTGSVLQQFVVGVPSGPVALPPLRICAGLGDCPTVDWLRVIWPDGVLQAELEVPGDRVMALEELQRKTSSCPLLFAWNGSRFEFIADFGGVGGLGYYVGPGAYAPPDPTEYLRIPRLEPRGGEFVLQVLGQLEEVVYFDEAKLMAVDHPAGTEVYPNEMMAVGAPPPGFEVFCYEEPIDPIRAVDHRGADVTEKLRAIDRDHAGATEPDHRFIGLAREHRVEFDFGDRLAAVEPGARLILFLFGWVEYGYSATNYAASQAGLTAKAPSLFARRDGAWVEVAKEVGYPAGINHLMTLDVTGKILPSDRAIMIASTMELYWDRIFLAVHRGASALVLTEVPAAAADLHARGYPREYSPDGRHPNLYDYENMDAVVAWKLMRGAYTRFGDVTELLGEADDCYVVMGHGEEITLRFSAAAFGPVPEGRTRTFILKTDSYCKDMDLYTAHPDTVEPLPFHGMSGYPYRADERYPGDEKRNDYRRRFNTRVIMTQ